ncbi:hypothetical protein F4861DRAFT_537222 [Xylaria intraflava]|nr:hypothetical protein F4861DRAFT_537222 [Xylaria intraflava]
MSPSAKQDEAGRLENGTLEPIAICGMACRLPGGVDSDSSFWKMLVEKRSGQTPRVPKTRFNIDAHYHEDLARPGSFNVAGGYFLDGNPEDFDPTFFNMAPIEAKWLDPQQRRMLEVSYECLVSAGITLESIAGSNTAVFVGSFTSDYQQMSTREPDFRHNYTATGVDTGIISNRIGNMFNLNGPSFTINTACSSSIYALHNACHALRSRDCDAAIVGGVNLIITVDQHMNTAKISILSPTSTCHTFDAAADGYGRAEGAGALFIKRLSDAIRDGDPIRGVIRSTAVNTNGKVEGMGITHPSVKGQERVVRMAYEKANLDPNQTAYAELHGTGTPVGDPIEVRAISRAMNDTRPTDKPLLIGAGNEDPIPNHEAGSINQRTVKPNIGHSEAASGIFAVMKAVLMTESSMIPGVAYFQTLNPEIKEKEWNVKVHANTAPWPQDSQVRRASVSSFGYGGTNGHVIVESIDALYPEYQHAKKKAETDSHQPSSPKAPFLLCFSAHDKPTLLRNVAATGAVAHEYHLADLAYTLNMRRTKFAHRTYVVARAGQESKAFSLAASQASSASKKPVSIGFLFTGQGAQWAGMGRAALQAFPVFAATIKNLDRILSKLKPKPAFSLVDLLTHDTENNPDQINAADISQPLCTALQIALVDLLAQWNITPEVSIGHSSGEIGAAYAAGLISAPEAILAAFCRGRAVTAHSTSGSMLAVSLGAHEVKQYLSSTAPEDVCIACENSPSSVTLSGREESISKLKAVLTAQGIFARELPTGRAYHSPHMAAVSTAYEDMLAAAIKEIPKKDLSWRRPRSQMISSVTGTAIDPDQQSLPTTYWSANLRNRVLFNTAVQQLSKDFDFEPITHLIEIGPHSALSGPFKQICQADKTLGSRITYIPSLKRREDDAERLLAVAGALFAAGHAVSLEDVNSSGDESPDITNRKRGPRHLLVDLPPYQWNYQKRYWAESRASAEQRARAYPRHDLLGSRVSGLSQNSATWRNVLRQRDVPWLEDHKLGETVIFPAAGHISLAIEALQQVSETSGTSFHGVKLRDIDIKTALVIPDDNEDGIEVILNLQTPTDATSTWHAFSVESVSEAGEWTVHCKGHISAISSPNVTPSSDKVPVDESALTQRVSGRRWYNAFHRVGFHYGKTFQQLHHARTARTLHQAAGDVSIREQCSGEMKGESRYLLHPSTIDACLHLIIICVNAGKHKEMPWGIVPTQIEEVTLYPAHVGGEVTVGHAVAWTDGFEGRRFNTNVRLSNSDGRLLLDIRNLTMTAYEAALPARPEHVEGEDQGPKPFSIMSWKPDITTLHKDDVDRLWPNASNVTEKLALCVGLIAHRQSISNALTIDHVSHGGAQQLVDSVMKVTPDISISIGVSTSENEDSASPPDSTKPRAQIINLDTEPENWKAASIRPHDLVIVNSDEKSHEAQHLESLLGLVTENGWLICPSAILTSSPFSTSKPSLHLDRYAILRKSAMTAHSNRTDPTPKRKITILSASKGGGSQNTVDLLVTLKSQNIVDEKTIVDFTHQEEHPVIVDDTTGAISVSMLEKETYFTAVKAVLTSGVPILWLTRGIRQGSPTGHAGVAGMAEGLLRVLRSEQAAVRITLLDVNKEEDPCDVSRAIIHTLSSIATKDSGYDVEFWLRRGILFISRVHDHDHLNRDFIQPQPQPVPLSGPLKLVNKTVDGQFVFERQRHRESSHLTDEQIEIEVLASDWPSYSAGSRTLVVGTVVRTGASADQQLTEKRAITFIHDAFQTVVNTSAYAIISDEHQDATPENLVRAISSLCPLAHLCLINAKLEKGDTITSLPGPEQDMKMLVKLATAMDWRLSIIISPDEDRNQYARKIGLDASQVLPSSDMNKVDDFISKQRKVSPSGTMAILAHDFDTHLAKEVWRNIPPSSRFLLLSEKPLETHLDPLPFSRGASFIPSSMRLLRKSAEATSSLLSLSLRLTEAHPSLLTTEIAGNDVQNVDIEDARQTASSRNRNAGDSNVVVIDKTRHLQLAPDATYLLVGCLGGLGRSLTKWMTGCGARHFAFISRSGIDKPEAVRLVKDIQRSGASTQVLRADASDEEAITRIVASLQSERPIRGVVHAAMVLKDGMFEQMTHKSFIDCVKPKAEGAWSLHKALQSAKVDPDFFVMTSSISALLGNTGQANYSAANSALDALARQRHAAGLAATSLVLPMVLDVGVVADNDSIEASLVRKGLYGIDEHEMLRGFEAAMLNSRPNSKDTAGQTIDESQIIMGMEPRELAASCVDTNLDAYWHQDARFCHTRAEMERVISGSNSDNNTSRQDENKDFTQMLKTAVAEGREAVIRVISEHVARRMSNILMIGFDNFELDGPASIASYGLDSMIGAELRTWLFKEFGIDYPFQKLLAPTLSFKMLSAAVIEKMGLLNAVE